MSNQPYLEFGITRYETLFGELTPIVDVSHHIRDIKVPSHKDLTFFQLDKVLSPDSVFIGFGKPNVYLGIPDQKGGFLKFDAKSLKRAKSKLVDTRNFAQSGLIFRLHIEDVEGEYCVDDILHSLYDSAEKEVGSKNWTCVNANSKVLNNAGFDLSLNNPKLSSFYFPMPLARKLIRDGLYYRGNKVKITVIRTVPLYLEDFGLSVTKAWITTFYRHAVRYTACNAKWLYNALHNTKNKVKAYFGNRKEDLPIEDHVTFIPSSYSSGSKYPMTITYPSKKGTFFRWIWGPHSFFTIKPDSNPVNEFLPESIKAYEAKSGTFFNFIKQNILFNKKVVFFIRGHLAKNESPVFMPTESELFNLIRTHTEENPHKYNLIITGNEIRVMKLGIKYKFVDWIMSKHILASSHSPDVRYAGEIWKTSDGVIHVSNDSGTYAPSNEMLDSVFNYFSEIFNEIKFNKQEAY